jgi:hypothetical protein
MQGLGSFLVRSKITSIALVALLGLSIMVATDVTIGDRSVEAVPLAAPTVPAPPLLVLMGVTWCQPAGAVACASNQFALLPNGTMHYGPSAPFGGACAAGFDIPAGVRMWYVMDPTEAAAGPPGLRKLVGPGGDGPICEAIFDVP